MFILKIIFKLLKIILVFFILLLIVWQIDTRFNTLNFLEKPNFFQLNKYKKYPEFPQDKETCEAQSGKWTKIGLSPDEECNLPTTDGGKTCKDSSDCQAHCLTEITDEIRKKSLAGKTIRTKGSCSFWYKVIGCHAFIEKGKAYTICID